MDKRQRLLNLFKEWANCQKEENSNNEGKTYLKGRHEIFVADGFISDNPSEEQKVLLIGKEANQEMSTELGKDDFWLKNTFINSNSWFENIEDEQEKRKSKRIATRFHNLIKEIYKGLGEDISINEVMHVTSFMNLNKRGGENHTNPKVVESYSEKYYEFIVREIEIINPTYIFCLGKNSTYDWLKKVFQSANMDYENENSIEYNSETCFRIATIPNRDKTYKVAETYHPSAPMAIYDVATKIAKAIKQ